MTTNKTLNLIASKLGVGDDEKVLRKAAEFERLLQTKSTAGSNMTDTSKIVICLNLAANASGVGLDIKSAIKYSGLKPLSYSNLRKMVENLLELNNDQITIPILCASLKCDEVQQLAHKVLEEYQKNAKVEIDLNLPQYVCMAVYQACRINKVKISKSKIMEKCHLKPMQWTKLDAEWTKFVDEYFTVTKTKRGRPAKKAVIEEEKEDKMDIQKLEVDSEPKIEIYEDWKRRMLETAYKELKEQQKREKEMEKESIKAVEQQKKEISIDKERVETMTPRRSPRKTPQKFSPYKNVQSPSKSKGVRLLFL